MKNNKIFTYSYWFSAPVIITGVFVYIGFTNRDISLLGIYLGMFFGLLDTLLSSKILFSIDQSNEKSKSTSQYSVLMAGFLIRMIIIFGGGFGLEQVEEYWGISFAITFLVMHFAHIGGFSLYMFNKMKLESQQNIETDETDSSNIVNNEDNQ